MIASHKQFVQLFLLIALIFVPQSVQAARTELFGESIFQLEQHRDIEQLRINKTRITQYLHLSLYGEEETKGHNFHFSFRIDADLGRDASPDAENDGVDYTSFALLYAYYEANRLGDVLDLQIGRNTLTDEMGFFSMDGLHLSIWRNWFVKTEIYGGVEVSDSYTADVEGFTIPNSDTHLQDGTTAADDVTGVFGLKLSLDGFKDSSASVHYRHLQANDTEGMFLGFTASHELFGFWKLYTANVANLYMERMSLVQFGMRFDFDWITGEIEHYGMRPDFDADSIFNFFRFYADKELSFKFYIRPDEKTHLNLRYARQHQGNDTIFFNDWGHDGNASDMAGFEGVRYLGDVAAIHADYAFQRGYGGDTHRAGVGGFVDAYHRRIRFEADVLGEYFHRLLYSDIVYQDRNKGFGWGLWLAAHVHITKAVKLTFRGDYYANDFIENQFAFFTLFDVHDWY